MIVYELILHSVAVRDIASTILHRLLEFPKNFLQVAHACGSYIFELFSIACNPGLSSFLRIRQNMVQSGIDVVRKYHQNRKIRYS